MRLCVLILARLCETGDERYLAGAGGAAFFTGLAESHADAAVRLLASQLVVNIMKRDPEKYRAHLQRVLAQAQRENDAKILSNAFFQLKAFYESDREGK